MVSHAVSRFVARILVMSIATLMLNVAGAAVTASVDRERVEQNESFTLEIVFDGDPDTAPDFSPLEADFFLGQTSQLSNTRILNGSITRSMTWTVALMAKRTGLLTIPPITIGNEQSDPVSIDVREPSYEPPGEADVFITSEIDVAEAYVQAQVLYTIKVYRAVATRQPALREPSYSGAEVLVEHASDERNYDAILNGRAYTVSERSYAIFPQESGAVSISPARFEARVLRDGRITGRKVFESESQTLTVKPIPPPPPEFPNAAWLPARELTLTDNWSRDLQGLRAGEPISRDITISVLGQLETQIPVIEAPDTDGISVYPDKPILGRRLDARGIRGERTDRYAMIGVAGGRVTLPKLSVPWWNVETGEWQVAEIPELVISIEPSADELLAVAVEEPAVAAAAAAVSAVTTPAVVESSFWKLIAEILAVVWLLTLVGWWWSGRPPRKEREPPPIPLHKQQAKTLKAARKAALASDTQGLKQALIEWGRLQWPDNPPRNIARLAESVSEPLHSELQKLSGISYGPRSGDWNGAALAKALRSFAVVDEQSAEASKDPLPPLMPQ